jgi:hypothetical protein
LLSHPQAGLKDKVTKSRKQIKEKKNRVKKLRGGEKVCGMPQSDC